MIKTVTTHFRGMHKQSGNWVFESNSEKVDLAEQGMTIGDLESMATNGVEQLLEIVTAAMKSGEGTLTMGNSTAINLGDFSFVEIKCAVDEDE